MEREERGGETYGDSDGRIVEVEVTAFVEVCVACTYHQEGSQSSRRGRDPPQLRAVSLKE